MGTESPRRRAPRTGQVAHVISGSEGELLAWSETLPAMLGLEPATIPATARAWLDCVHPHDHERFRETAIAAAKRGGRVEIEYRLRCGRGKWLNLSSVIEPLDQEKYEAPGGLWLSTLQDVTAAKSRRRAPRTSQRSRGPAGR